MQMDSKAISRAIIVTAAALCGIQPAAAMPLNPNGSFGFIPVGSTTATSSSGWEVGPNTTIVTIPAYEFINTSTTGSSYLGNPDNLAVSAGGTATLNNLIFNIPALGAATDLTAPLVVTVTNQASDIMTFTFNQVTATSSGNGSLNLYWSGNLTSDSLGGFQFGIASLSAAFTASNASAVGNASFSLASPPELDPVPTPEPTTLALIGTSLLGLGAVRRRTL